MMRYPKFCVKLLPLVLLLPGGWLLALPQGDEPPTEVVGVLLVQVPEGAPFPNIAGKTLPEKDFPVYLISWKDSKWLRDWLGKLQRDLEKARKAPADPDNQWIVEKRREDIYEHITHSVAARSTRTDNHGRFKFEGLSPGERYVVIAADLKHEVGIILTPEIVGPLTPGENRVSLVNEW